MTAGFDQINRILWVIVLPIAMDAFLWLAPRVTAAPVVHRLTSSLSSLYDSMAGNGIDPGSISQLRDSLGAFDAGASDFNLLTLLVTNLAGLPSILPAAPSTTAVFEIGSVGSLALAALGAELVGMFLGCVYFGVIAQQVRDGRVAPLRLARRVWRYWGTVLAFIALVIGACLALSIPIGLAVGLVQVILPGFGPVLLAIVAAVGNIVLVFLVLYLFFLLDAIVVSEAGPIRAALNSARVVASNFWSAVGFIVIIIVISLGTQQIWQAISGNPLGTVLAIGANSYISSGLTAASMLYYQSRVSRLPATRGVVGRVPLS
jgi:hypothetical protein